MTDLDPAPAIPSCPVCVTREQVERVNGRWLCGLCWTVFTGGQGEWDRTRDLREAWRKLDAWRQALPKETADQ